VELLDDAKGESLTWELLHFSSLVQDTEEAKPLLTLSSSGCVEVCQQHTGRVLQPTLVISEYALVMLQAMPFSSSWMLILF
jgi:hypothetical protein